MVSGATSLYMFLPYKICIQTYTSNKRKIYIVVVVSILRMGKLKKSEARILVYLSQVANNLRYPFKISSKLDIGYSYTLQILERMLAKGWIAKIKVRGRSFYKLSETAPLEQSLDLIKQ